MAFYFGVTQYQQFVVIRIFQINKKISSTVQFIIPNLKKSTKFHNNPSQIHKNMQGQI